MQVCCKHIHYMCLIISGEGVAVDPEKVKCILDYPELKKCERGPWIFRSHMIL